MSTDNSNQDTRSEESDLAKYGDLPPIACSPAVAAPPLKVLKRPTHFLAIRLNSPALWSHVFNAVECHIV